MDKRVYGDEPDWRCGFSKGHQVSAYSAECGIAGGIRYTRRAESEGLVHFQVLEFFLGCSEITEVIN